MISPTDNTSKDALQHLPDHPTGAPAPTLQSRLIGRWRLRGCVATHEGRTLLPLGHDPHGMLIYTRECMMVFLSAHHRPSFSTDDVRAIPADEVTADFARYESYYGHYRVDDTRHIVTHVVQSSKIPNHIGAELSRHVRLQNDTLVLTSTTDIWLHRLPWRLELGWIKEEAWINVTG